MHLILLSLKCYPTKWLTTIACHLELLSCVHRFLYHRLNKYKNDWERQQLRDLVVHLSKARAYRISQMESNPEITQSMFILKLLIPNKVWIMSTSNLESPSWIKLRLVCSFFPFIENAMYDCISVWEVSYEKRLSLKYLCLIYHPCKK